MPVVDKTSAMASKVVVAPKVGFLPKSLSGVMRFADHDLPSANFGICFVMAAWFYVVDLLVGLNFARRIAISRDFQRFIVQTSFLHDKSISPQVYQPTNPSNKQNHTAPLTRR